MSIKLAITVHETEGLARHCEPVHIRLPVDTASGCVRATLDDGVPVPAQVYTDADGASTVVLVMSCGAHETKELVIDLKPMPVQETGFVTLSPYEKYGGVAKLDTGVYVTQLGKGLADGTLSGKWGLNVLTRKDEGVNLIEGNAFGGVYGPFFTQENACGKYHPELGVGAQHYTMQFRVLDNGPLFWRGVLEGTPPPGADPDVSNKRVTAYFMFYAGSDWFDRQYFVEDYETCIWGETVRNMMTVGDETNVTIDGHTAFQEVRFFGRETNETHYLVGAPPNQAKTVAGWLDFEDNTVWPYDVQYLAFRNSYNGASLLYAYSNPIHTFQLANFEASSDWFNVGTNGYCEIPCLPSGTRIRNAYGTFENIEHKMTALISPLEISLTHPEHKSGASRNRQT